MIHLMVNMLSTTLIWLKYKYVINFFKDKYGLLELNSIVFFSVIKASVYSCSIVLMFNHVLSSKFVLQYVSEVPWCCNFEGQAGC